MDLRTLDPRPIDPRLVRGMGDQDMRTGMGPIPTGIPTQAPTLPNFPTPTDRYFFKSVFFL